MTPVSVWPRDPCGDTGPTPVQVGVPQPRAPLPARSRWVPSLPGVLRPSLGVPRLQLGTLPTPLTPIPPHAPRRALAMEPGTIDNLSILYQSSDFIVVNKHWDIRIDSRMWYETLTLQSQLKHRFPELADPDTYYGFR